MYFNYERACSILRDEASMNRSVLRLAGENIVFFTKICVQLVGSVHSHKRHCFLLRV